MRFPRMPLALVGAALLSLAVGIAPASADRVLLSEHLLDTRTLPVPLPPPEGEIEGACGLAVRPGGPLYVSDYYHRVVDVFGTTGNYQSQIGLPGADPPFGSKTLDAVCGLAVDSAGRLYANEWHQGVLRLLPSEAAIDGDQSTGVAVDGAGNVYVDDRTRVAKYASPVQPGNAPVAEIGGGSLGDGYGLAVSPSGSRVYVADAADDTVKVYEPSVSLSAPAQTITGFNSLVDAALAVDPTNGHLLVVDNVQPGFEHPKAVVLEYDSSGALLGPLPGSPVHGEPSGLAVEPNSGEVYVTSGNDEGANVFAYGPYSAPFSPGSFASPQASSPAQAQSEAPTGAAVSPSPVSARTAAAGRLSASASEVIQRGGVRIKVDGQLAPTRLPRRGAAPVRVRLDTEIAATHGGTPPQLRRITIAINRNGRFDSRGLPVCRLAQVQPSSSQDALAACGASLVGEGNFSADVKLPEQSPFPSAGKVLAFNGALGGRAVILMHVFGTKPVPTSFTVPLAIEHSKGTYGTVLSGSLPEATGDSGFITGLQLSLGRSFRFRGRSHSYISASCPAPAGFPGAVFPLARTSFDFAGRRTLTSVLTSHCKVR